MITAADDTFYTINTQLYTNGVKSIISSEFIVYPPGTHPML